MNIPFYGIKLSEKYYFYSKDWNGWATESCLRKYIPGSATEIRQMIARKTNNMFDPEISTSYEL